LLTHFVMIEHSDHRAPASNTIEDDIINDPERIQRGLALCHRVADSNPALVMCYLNILPNLKDTRHEIEQILLKIARISPQTILENVDQLTCVRYGKQAVKLAQQNINK